MPGGSRQLFDPEAPPLAAAPEPDPAPSGGRTATAYDPDLHRDTHPDVLSVGGLYESVDGALARAFPRNRPLWVRGEIVQLSDHRSGHLYFDLVDPDDDGRGGRPARTRGRGGVPTLSVKCWRTTWAPLRHRLAKAGIELAEGMVVVLRGTLDLYRAKGEISLILVEVDVTALLGRLAAERAQLLRTLETEGLLRANASLPLPEVPLARRAGGQSRHRGLPRLPRPADLLGIRLPRLAREGARAGPRGAGLHRPRADHAVEERLRRDRRRPGRGCACGSRGVRDRGGGAGRGEFGQARVHRHRPQRRRDGGRRGGGTGLHHADRVRAASRGGRASLVGRPRRRAGRATGPARALLPR